MDTSKPPRRGVLLLVPFKEKDEAKKLGAWWDPDLKRWFVPEGRDPAPFARWIPGSPVIESQRDSERERSPQRNKAGPGL